MIPQFLLASIAPDDRLTFAAPAWFWALLLLLPLAWLFRESARQRTLLLSRILAPRLQSTLAGRVSPLRRTLRALFLFLGLALVVTGLARPRYGSVEREIRSSGRDVILGIDTSRSMLSTDTAPTRLGRAKLIAQDLLNLLKGDRVGLIAFAGNAFLQAPLTLDKGAVLTSIQDLDTGTIPKGGTDIASAIRMAIAAFGKGETMSRALVLMTDGEDLDNDSLEAAKEAAVAGVRIFTIGFGSPGGSLIPVRTEEGRNDFVRDEGGRPVNSRLDAERLTKIAQETGGFYQPFGQDAASLIYTKGILPMEQQEGGVMSSRRPIERYAWPITAAILLLVLWIVLGEGKGGRPGAVAALLLLVGLAGIPSLRADPAGLSDYRKGNYTGALKDFEKRLQSGSKAPEVGFDAGAAAYKAGDFKKAAGYFSSAMTSKEAPIREAATYNLANALVRSGEAAKEKEAKLSDWKNALQHYETVFKADPKNTPAKENAEIVRKLIEDLKKEPPQKQKNQSKEKKDQDQNKDQEKKSDQSQGGGDGQKDSKDQKNENQKDQDKGKGSDSKDQKDQQDQKDKKDQKDSKGGGGQQDHKQDQDSGMKPQGSPSPSPTPSPSPGEGKEKESGKNDSGTPRNNNSQGSGSPQEPKKEGKDQQPPGGGAQPGESPSPTPRKEGALGGGEQGDRKQDQPSEAAEAEEGKDGSMSPNQARALLRSVQDEEAHQLMNQQNRAVEQPLRDW